METSGRQTELIFRVDPVVGAKELPNELGAVNIPPRLADEIKPHLQSGKCRFLTDFVTEALAVRLGQLRALEGIGRLDDIEEIKQREYETLQHVEGAQGDEHGARSDDFLGATRNHPENPALFCFLCKMQFKVKEDFRIHLRELHSHEESNLDTVVPVA